MIQIKDIAFAYGKSPVLRGISFDVRSGECLGVLGNNGAGKSTLITCLNKIRRPRTGSVIIDGVDVLSLSGLEIARRIAYVAQKNEISQITVFDAVLLGRKPNIKWSVSQTDLDLCDQVIRDLGLADFKLRLIHQLSGGELQKVMLARALVQQPRLLLLDEPTSNLDPKNQHDMMAQVSELTRQKGFSTIVVMHDLSLALRFCDRFLLLKDGQVYCFGDASVVSAESLHAVYGIKARVESIHGRPIVLID